MLAILTTGHITVTEHSALRRAPAMIRLARSPNSCGHLPDGGDIPSENIGGLTVKDKGPLILSMGSAVHIEHSDEDRTNIARKRVNPDSDPIHALSLSHDSTLLTVASPGAVVLPNLALGAQTTLRGLPGRGASRCARSTSTRWCACSWE